MSESLSEWAPTATISFSEEENDTKLDTPKDMDSLAGTCTCTSMGLCTASIELPLGIVMAVAVVVVAHHFLRL